MPLKRYGTGFLKGLTQVAGQARADARADEDKKSRNALMLLQLAAQSDDPVLLQSALETLSPDLGLPGATKGGGKRAGAGGGKGGDPQSMIAQLLLGGIGGGDGGQQAPGQAPAGGGLRLEAPEARRERTAADTASQAGATRTGQLDAQIAVARRMFDQRIFPTLEASLAAVGIRDPQVLSATSMQSVAGELPDGTPTFGVFDRRPSSPTFGQYIGSDGEVLEGFQPRTATGSRSMGVEREALSREMFGVPPSQLNQEQMGLLNRRLPERAGELAEARGLGTGAARIETELGMPMTEAEVARQDVPFGTTMRDLVGFEPVTPEQRSRKAAVTALAPQLTQIRELIGTVFPAASGLTGALTASAVLAQKRTSRDPDMASLTAAINLAIGNVARVIAAETGRLTEQDAERARSALADLQGFTDTRESALAKLTRAEEAMTAIAGSIRTPGEQMRQQGDQGSLRLRARQFLLDNNRPTTPANIDFLLAQPGIEAQLPPAPQ